MENNDLRKKYLEFVLDGKLNYLPSLYVKIPDDDIDLKTVVAKSISDYYTNIYHVYRFYSIDEFMSLKNIDKDSLESLNLFKTENTEFILNFYSNAFYSVASLQKKNKGRYIGNFMDSLTRLFLNRKIYLSDIENKSFYNYLTLNNLFMLNSKDNIEELKIRDLILKKLSETHNYTIGIWLYPNSAPNNYFERILNFTKYLLNYKKIRFSLINVIDINNFQYKFKHLNKSENDLFEMEYILNYLKDKNLLVKNNLYNELETNNIYKLYNLSYFETNCESFVNQKQIDYLCHPITNSLKFVDSIKEKNYIGDINLKYNNFGEFETESDIYKGLYNSELMPCEYTVLKNTIQNVSIPKYNRYIQTIIKIAIKKNNNLKNEFINKLNNDELDFSLEFLNDSRNLYINDFIYLCIEDKTVSDRFLLDNITPMTAEFAIAIYNRFKNSEKAYNFLMNCFKNNDDIPNDFMKFNSFIDFLGDIYTEDMLSYCNKLEVSNFIKYPADVFIEGIIKVKISRLSNIPNDVLSAFNFYELNKI